MSLEEDAAKFGRHFEGGWQLGLLVARNVHKRSRAGRPPISEPLRNKVSCAKFAKMAGVSERTIQWYCDTWALAAEAGHCTPADQLSPGEEDPRLSGIDVDSYEVHELWNKCYREVRERRAKNGNAESDTRRQRRKRSTDETSSAESESCHADGTGSDPKAHPLYGLLLDLNQLSDELKRGGSAASIRAAAEKVAAKAHRAALRRITGEL